jgi:hypothetical protein
MTGMNLALDPRKSRVAGHTMESLCYEAVKFRRLDKLAAQRRERSAKRNARSTVMFGVVAYCGITLPTFSSILPTQDITNRTTLSQ